MAGSILPPPAAFSSNKRQAQSVSRCAAVPRMSQMLPRPVQQLGVTAGSSPTTYGTHSLKACYAVLQASWSRAAVAAAMNAETYQVGIIRSCVANLEPVWWSSHQLQLLH